MSENSPQIKSARADKALLLAELQAAGAQVHGAAIRCPFHEDAHPSAEVYEKDGVWRYRCHAGSCGFKGDIFDVRARRTDRRVEDVLREASGQGDSPQQADKPATREKTWPSLKSIRELFESKYERVFEYLYQAPMSGTVDLVVFRLEPGANGRRKDFRQVSKRGSRWVMKAPEGLLPIYNRSRIAGEDEVFVVEGEKCVHAMHEIGFVATTSPAGAGKAHMANWSPLAGKTVYLWPDNDPVAADGQFKGERPGFAHMRQVAEILEKLQPAPTVYHITPPTSLPEKGDAADYIAWARHDGRDASADIQELMRSAVRVGASSIVAELIEKTISGERRAVPWPWDRLTAGTRALMPGTVTVVCGDPGDGKSFFLLQCMRYWRRNGERVAVLEMERDRGYHLFRLLAQEAQSSELLNDEWVRANPISSRGHLASHQRTLDELGPCLWDRGSKRMTLDHVKDWIEHRISEGYRVVAVDPITKADAGENRWVQDEEFVDAVKLIVERANVSLVMVSHPRKGGSFKGGMDDLAGGKAFANFTDCVLWMRRHEPAKELTVWVEGAMGRLKESVKANREMMIFKARDGPGGGGSIAFRFSRSTLTFEELGPVDHGKDKNR